MKNILDVFFRINNKFFRKTSISKLVGKRKLNFYKKSRLTRFKLKYFIQLNSLYSVEEEKELKDNQRLRKIAIATEIKFKKYKVEGNVYLLLRLLKSSAAFDDNLDPAIDKLASLFGQIKEVANFPKYYEVKIVIKEAKENVLIKKNMTVEKPEQKHKLKINKFITVDLNRSPGILLAAPSGGGKSFYLMYLLSNMLKETNNIFVIDGKFKEIKSAALQMGIKTAADSLEKSIDYIYQVEKMVDYRNSLETREFNDTVFLIIDEYTVFLDKILTKYGHKKLKEVENKLINIVLSGRSVNIIVVLALQRLGAAKNKEEVGLSLRIRDNIATKIGLADLSRENFEMLFGQTKDNKIIKRKTGQGYVKAETEEVNGLQAFDVANIELDQDFII
jgi:hypothetical protein